MHSSQVVVCYFKYSDIMKNSKDKKIYRMRMVQYAIQHGNKPAARVFCTTVKTVRKWRKRFEEFAYKGLEDQSRAPKNPAVKIDEKEKYLIIQLKKRHPGFGAQTFKNDFSFKMSIKAK